MLPALLLPELDGPVDLRRANERAGRYSLLPSPLPLPCAPSLLSSVLCSKSEAPPADVAPPPPLLSFGAWSWAVAPGSLGRTTDAAAAPIQASSYCFRLRAAFVHV
jgi:hypothetical protein